MKYIPIRWLTGKPYRTRIKSVLPAKSFPEGSSGVSRNLLYIRGQKV
jgi:hypothetical protein